MLSVTEAAREAPGAAAFVTRDGAVTFAEAASRARRVARWLARREVRGPIGLVPTLRADSLVALYAAFDLGVPVALLHPRLTAHERAALGEMVGAALILDENWSEAAVHGDAAADDDAGASSGASEARAAVDDAATLAFAFTSGTSGTPKGVALSRRAFMASAAASAKNLGWRPDDRWVLSMPLAHVGGLSTVVRCLLARRAVVLSPWSGDVAPLLDDIARCRVTLVSLVPTMLRRILDAVPGRPFPEHVRAILLGGDAAPAPLLEECAARSVPALATYGMTEACSQVATQTFGERPSPDAGVGRPLDGVDVRIVDGEIHVRGATMMTEYVPRERWPSPFLEGGWFRTGDVGAFDASGRLHVVGRCTDRIITGGENVDPLEVEQAMLGCTSIREACVFGVPDPLWGQAVAAALVVAGDADLEAIAEHVATRLAAFKRPRLVTIVDALPRNATGKLDRRSAASMLRDRLVPLPKR